jgi:nitroreductase/NAD-dependent dihydropyrimidine dehydrogenase PreA subunit
MVIDTEKCTECGICVDACINGAIDLESKKIEESICAHCGHCLALCPSGAVSLPGKTVPLLGDIPVPRKFETLVQRRRSCRNYLDRPVAPETMNALTETVRYAPTGTNTQSVFISALSGRETVKKLADSVYSFLSTLSRRSALLAPLLAIALGPKKAARVFRMKRLLARYADGSDIITYGAPALLAFHAPRSSSTPEEDCVIWATTAVYHAETLGLGSCWSGFIKYAARYDRGLRRMLGIPKGHTLFSVVILGYPKYRPHRGVLREAAKIIAMH